MYLELSSVATVLGIVFVTSLTSVRIDFSLPLGRTAVVQRLGGREEHVPARSGPWDGPQVRAECDVARTKKEVSLAKSAGSWENL